MTDDLTDDRALIGALRTQTVLTHPHGHSLRMAAADLIERQAREIADLNRAWKAMLDRAERAEAERDALRECVKAADVMRDRGLRDATCQAYDAARAKVKP